MYDRPTLNELLDAVRLHLESTIVPAVRGDGKAYFQTLVAINLLKIAGRELALAPEHARAEWERLNQLQGTHHVMPEDTTVIQIALAERNAALAEDIRAGRADDKQDTLLEHLKQTAIAQLEVANPRFLKKLAAEDADPAIDAWHKRT